MEGQSPTSNSLDDLDPLGRAAIVKGWARELGADLVGVAHAEFLREEAGFLRRWLAEGRHADMNWLGRDPDRRANPEALLPGCRSVIVVGVDYYIRESANDYDSAATPAGRIAQYARREDYHRSVGRIARRLAQKIAAQYGNPEGKQSSARGIVRWAVDTAPIFEKAWARRAGIGFIGKNTCLIHPALGSWILLGVVLTALDLAPDAPMENKCGACRQCMDACPTGALVAPGVLDARRCLSYLTIEHRGEIDAALRPHFTEWLFGCDACQEACPHNQKRSRQASGPGGNATLGQVIHPKAIPLEDVLKISSDDDLVSRYGAHSPLRRAKAEGLKRCAALLLAQFKKSAQ
jgi:epoxyqueuosine reductase